MEDLAALGWEPYRGTEYQRYDQDVIAYALAQFDLSRLAQRNSQTLSGGEQHRAHLARALAQILPAPDAPLDGKWLLLDEPTNHLDIAHAHRLMQTIASLTARGLTVISVLHDPALALNHAAYLLLLKDGRIHAACTPAELCQTPEMLGEIYGIILEISQHCGRHYLHLS